MRRGDDQAAVIAKTLVDLQRDPDDAHSNPLSLSDFHVTYNAEPAPAPDPEDTDWFYELGLTGGDRGEFGPDYPD